MQLGKSAMVDQETDGAGGNLPEPDDYVPRHLEPLWHVLMRVFGRTPLPRELEMWGAKLKESEAHKFVRMLVNSKSFSGTKFVRAKNPPGHYFSPVVDPDLVRDYVEMNRRAFHSAHKWAGYSRTSLRDEFRWISAFPRR